MGTLEKIGVVGRTVVGWEGTGNLLQKLSKLRDKIIEVTEVNEEVANSIELEFWADLDSAEEIVVITIGKGLGYRLEELIFKLDSYPSDNWLGVYDKSDDCKFELVLECGVGNLEVPYIMDKLVLNGGRYDRILLDRCESLEIDSREMNVIGLLELDEDSMYDLIIHADNIEIEKFKCPYCGEVKEFKEFNKNTSNEHAEYLNSDYIPIEISIASIRLFSCEKCEPSVKPLNRFRIVMFVSN